MNLPCFGGETCFTSSESESSAITFFFVLLLEGVLRFWVSLFSNSLSESSLFVALQFLAYGFFGVPGVVGLAILNRTDLRIFVLCMNLKYKMKIKMIRIGGKDTTKTTKRHFQLFLYFVAGKNDGGFALRRLVVDI